jgi:multiple sugar transport system substrate-binding protein
LTEGYAVPRPRTPAYPVITSAFQAAFMDIRNNGKVQQALDRAVQVIDQDIADNKGYP